MLAFNESQAIKYGLKEAIILHKVIFYILLNRKEDRNLRNGRHWTFNPRDKWREIFPMFSKHQIWRSFKSLEEQGALVTDSFNRMAYDKTTWYSLSDAMLKECLADEYWKKAIYKSVKPIYKNAKPIPLNKKIIQVNPY
jgi:hypothetical protein